MKTINWEADCKGNYTPNKTIIEALVNRLSKILNITHYEGSSLRMTLNIEEWRINSLFDEISKIAELRCDRPTENESKAEVMIYLNISFKDSQGAAESEGLNLSLE